MWWSKDLIVPAAAHLSPLDGSTLEGTLGRVPIVCNMAAGYAAQLLGCGTAAVDALIELTTSKPVVDPGPGIGERPAVLAAIAEHRVRIAAAREYLHACVARLWTRRKQAGDPPGDRGGVRSRASRDGAGTRRGRAMYALAGASALYTSSPLERAHRDVHAMAAHVIAQPMWLEDTGRVLLGLKPLNPCT